MSERSTRYCPACAEEILAAAQKCEHCGEWSEPSPVAREDRAEGGGVEVASIDRETHASVSDPAQRRESKGVLSSEKRPPADAARSERASRADQTGAGQQALSSAGEQYANIPLVIALAPLLALIWFLFLGYTDNETWTKEYVHVKYHYAVYSSGFCAAVFIASALASRRLAGAVYLIPFLALAWDAKLGGTARIWMVLDGLGVAAIADLCTRYRPSGWQLLRAAPLGLGIGFAKALPLLIFAKAAYLDKHGTLAEEVWTKEISGMLEGELVGAAFLQSLWLCLALGALMLATTTPSKLRSFFERLASASK